LHAAAATTSPAATLLMKMLADKQARATEVIFRLLALINPQEDFERIYRGLHGNRIDRASGRELLDGVVQASTRDIVLVLLEERADPAQLARLGADAGSGGYDETIRSIIETSSGALRTIAVRHREAAAIPAAV
jgi:hypothetical protein